MSANEKLTNQQFLTLCECYAAYGVKVRVGFGVELGGDVMGLDLGLVVMG